MIQFFVPGIPSPGGSKRGFLSKYPSKKSGKHFVVMQDMGGKRTEQWRRCVEAAGAAAMCGKTLFDVPLMVVFAFYVERPKFHFRSNGTVKDSAPEYPDVAPDTTKLVRSTEDALKMIVWTDDCKIVKQAASKDYAGDESPRTGCMITIHPLAGRRSTR